MDKIKNSNQTNNPSINNNNTTIIMNSDLEKIINKLNNVKDTELESELFHFTQYVFDRMEDIEVEHQELEVEHQELVTLHELLKPYYKKLEKNVTQPEIEKYQKQLKELIADMFFVTNPDGKITTYKSVLSMVHKLVEDGQLSKLDKLFKSLFPEYYSL